MVASIATLSNTPKLAHIPLLLLLLLLGLAIFLALWFPVSYIRSLGLRFLYVLGGLLFSIAIIVAFTRVSTGLHLEGSLLGMLLKSPYSLSSRTR